TESSRASIAAPMYWSVVCTSCGRANRVAFSTALSMCRPTMTPIPASNNVTTATTLQEAIRVEDMFIAFTGSSASHANSTTLFSMLDPRTNVDIVKPREAGNARSSAPALRGPRWTHPTRCGSQTDPDEAFPLAKPAQADFVPVFQKPTSLPARKRQGLATTGGQLDQRTRLRRARAGLSTGSQQIAG